MYRTGAALLFLIVLIAPSYRSLAQELVETPIEDLVAQEELRSAVETALSNYTAATGGRRIDVALEGIRSLIPYGEKAVPYLAAELEQEDHGTYDFVTYALGFLDEPAASAALLEAIEFAETSPGTAALARKAWACWALGLHGEIDALKLVNEGNHQSASFSVHRQTTVLEAIALQTAPESVPVLLEQLETWGEMEEKSRDRRFVLRALRRLGNPTSMPALIEIIEQDQDEDEPALRAQAADALRSFETSASVAALVTALKDPVPGVRRAAAFALKWMDRPGDVQALIEHLATEDDLRVREGLYEVIAAHAKPEQIPQFLAQWNRPAPEDRRHFVVALARMQSAEKMPILSAALQDPSPAVARLAVDPLASAGGKASVDRLEEVLASSEKWSVVSVIAKAARANGLSGLAPALTQRLLEAAQLEPKRQPDLMSAVDRMAEAIVEFRYTPALSKLQRTRQSVKDPEMVEVFDGTIDALKLLRTNGKNVAKWAPLLKDPDSGRSRLARHRLAELGGEEATAALLNAYDDLDILARIDTLLLLQQLDSPAVRGLLRRLLLAPNSYSVELEGERKTAAWIVRSFGDQEMLDLLIEAIRLRDGREVENLIYAAAVGGERALPLLREYRLSRLRYLGLGRGYEQEVLDWIARRLENGLPIERYDQPPLKLTVR